MLKLIDCIADAIYVVISVRIRSLTVGYRQGHMDSGDCYIVQLILPTAIRLAYN